LPGLNRWLGERSLEELSGGPRGGDGKARWILGTPEDLMGVSRKDLS